MGGVSTLYNQIRKRFHVVRLKRKIAEVVQKCFRCVKKSWKPLQMPLPPFHPARCGNQQPLRAFLEIGIDHMGPFHLKQGRSTVEGHVLVMACCATRAINLEMSLSTGSEHIVAALQRHVGVYGGPTHINSDGAPGFVKARRVIQENESALKQDG